MSIELLGEPEIKERIARIMVARQHWIILPGLSGGGCLSEIEDAFYSGERNQHDFEIMIGGMTGAEYSPLLAVAFAHKRHLSAERFAEFINKRLRDTNSPDGDITSEILGERDVIFLAKADEAYGLASDFYKWISPAIEEIEKEEKENETWPKII